MHGDAQVVALERLPDARLSLPPRRFQVNTSNGFAIIFCIKNIWRSAFFLIRDFLVLKHFGLKTFLTLKHFQLGNFYVLETFLALKPSGLDETVLQNHFYYNQIQFYHIAHGDLQ